MPQDAQNQLQYVAPLRQALDSAQIPGDPEAANKIRGAAYNAFFSGQGIDDFQKALNGVDGLPNDTKLKLLGIRFPEAGKVIEQKQTTRAKEAKSAAAAVPESRLSTPGLLPGAPPGADKRPSSRGLPPVPGATPDASSLWGALSTPLTETLGGKSVEGVMHERNQNFIASLPEWARPVAKFGSGVEETIAGVGDQFTAPLSILMAPLGAAAEAEGQLPRVARMTSRAFNAIAGAANVTDAAQHAYNYFRTGDTGEIGKGAAEIPLALIGIKGARGSGGSPAQEKAGIAPTISHEAEPAERPNYAPPGPPGIASGPETRRVGAHPAMRQLPAPSAERSQIEAIANAAGPFKSQVHDWARKDLAEIQKLREQAQASFQTVQRQYGAETAPFAERGEIPSSNAAQGVPKGSTRSIPQGKGEFTPGGPRVLLDRARAQYEALDKLYRMKAKQEGIAIPENAPPPGGRPSGTSQGPPLRLPVGAPGPGELRGLPAPAGAHEPPPGAIRVNPISQDYRAAQMQAGPTPISRQIAGPESRVLSPQLSMAQNLKEAEFMPQAILQDNIEKMRAAAAVQASQMVHMAGKDPEKLMQAKAWIDQAKTRIDQFQGVYNRIWGEPEAPAAETKPAKDETPKPKREPKPKKAETKPEPPPNPAKPESKPEPPVRAMSAADIPPEGITLGGGKTISKMDAERGKTASGNKPKEEPPAEGPAPVPVSPKPKPSGKPGKAAAPKSDQKGFVDLIAAGGKDNPHARQVFSALQRGDNKAAVETLVKGGWKESEAKGIVDDAAAQVRAAGGPSTKKTEPKAAASASVGTMSQRLGTQFEGAEQRGVKRLKLTIVRGGGKKDLVIGINTDLDSPEEIAQQIAQSGGANGMARLESAEPERPFEYKFLLGDAEAPPGGKKQ